MTNFERIKAMDIKELCEFLLDEICDDCSNCTIANFKYEEQPCMDVIQKWLEREVKENEPFVYCKDCKYAYLTYDGFCKSCDKFPELEEPYFPGDFYCASGERKEDK